MQKWHGASLSFLGFCLITLTATASERPSSMEIPIGIGVILDLNSSLGTMALNCIRIGLQDFYSQNPHYTTRLHLHIRESHHDVLTAASAALDLIKNEKVHAIVGPQTSEQAWFVVQLGTKAQVPIISFSATSPSLFATQSDCSQFKAIAAIVELYGWHEFIPIYEDTEYGNALIPCLTYALEEMDTRTPYRSAIDPHLEEAEILKEIDHVKGMQTHVFLVHLTADIGSKFFKLAHKAGMMSEGYAWMITQGLSAMIDPSVPKLVMGYMQGVLGVRPMVQKTKKLVDLKRRWKVQSSNHTILTLFGLWAYDTVHVLADAVEKVGVVNFTFQKPNITCENTVDVVRVGIQETGLRLLKTILATKFKGSSGDFNLTDGQLEPSVLEVFNVIGHKERIIGYWTPQRGLFRNLGDYGQPIGEEKLKQPIWPGDTLTKPPKLRIGVPARKGFTESFVKVEWQSENVTAKVSGFAIDLFSEVVKVLPFSLRYDFVPLTKKNEVTGVNQTYEELLCQIKEKKLDAIVGDITILANRTKCVDFALPYLESSVSMMALRSNFNSRVLLSPFDKSLWIVIGCIFGSATITIILLEVFKFDENRGWNKLVELFSFPLSVYSRERKDWKSNLSKWLALVISFIFVMVVQIYTANLTSMLTQGTMTEPLHKNIEEIKKKNYSVGYQRESFVKGLLIDLGLNQSQLKPYDTLEDYQRALSLKTKDGGVDAIFDETPYIMLFLSKYGADQYTTVGPRYQTDGFGFAFPRRSGLISHISAAILNVIQDRQKLEDIKKNNSLSTPLPSQYEGASQIRSLTLNDFSSFFEIVIYIILGLVLIGFVRYIMWTFVPRKSIFPSLGNQPSFLTTNEYEMISHMTFSPKSTATVRGDLPNKGMHVREPFIPY